METQRLHFDALQTPYCEAVTTGAETIAGLRGNKIQDEREGIGEEVEEALAAIIVLNRSFRKRGSRYCEISRIFLVYASEGSKKVPQHNYQTCYQLYQLVGGERVAHSKVPHRGLKRGTQAI